MSVTAVPIPPIKRGYLVWLWLGIVAAILAALALAWTGTAAVVAEKGTNEQFLAWNASRAGVETTPSGLQYQVLEPGEGATPTDNDLTLVNYVGRLRNGEIFDQSQQPVPMSPKGVVPGFGEALKLMPKGAKYRFWIKPELGYGADAQTDPRTGEDVIPANSILVFDVELVDFVSEEVVRQMQMQQMMQMQMQMRQGGAPGGAEAPSGE